MRQLYHHHEMRRRLGRQISSEDETVTTLLFSLPEAQEETNKAKRIKDKRSIQRQSATSRWKRHNNPPTLVFTNYYGQSHLHKDITQTYSLERK